MLSVLLFSVVLLSSAQIGKIPAEVTDAFAARYPHATKVEWRDKPGYYQASFQLNGQHITADFSSGGAWQRSERVLNYNDLPDEVQDGFQKSKFSDWNKNWIIESQESGKPLEYRMNIQKTGLKKKNLYFDVNGKLLKETIAL